MAGLSYMQRRRSGIYEFRKRLPTELAGQPAPGHLSIEFAELVNPKTGHFKGEIVRSLGTSDYREAKRRDLREARKVLLLFDAATSAMAMVSGNVSASRPKPTPELEEIEAETIAELLAQDEAERSEGDDRRHLQSREERAQWPALVPIAEPWAKGMAEEHAFAYGIEIEELVGEYRQAHARRDPGIVRAETHLALRRHGIPIDPTSALYHEVGVAVLRAHVRAFDAMLRRHRGDVIENPPSPAVAKKRAVETKGPKLSEAFAAWQEGSSAARNAKKPTPRTILEARVAVRWFIELHADMRLGEITKLHAREFQRAAAKVPKSRAGNLRGLPLPKLIEHTSRKPASDMRGAATINKSINMLAAITSFALRLMTSSASSIRSARM